MTDMLIEARKVFEKEIAAIERTKDHIGEVFIEFLETIMACDGKVILTGMGKSGHIAKKIAATFSSLGTPAFYIHPAESLHGDLGMVTDRDVIIAISHSGESAEVLQMIPVIHRIGAKLLSITGDAGSTLAKHSDVAEILPQMEEACHLGLAPTSTTTAELVYGDALAVTVSQLRGFRSEDFGLFHPAGALGRKLITTVSDIMVSGTDKPQVNSDVYLKEAIIELSRKKAGIVAVMQEDRIAGIITEGNLRRALEQEMDVYSMKVDEIMTRNPVCITEGKLAVDAMKLLHEKNISSLIVLDGGGKYSGVVTLQMVINAL
ncbi:MAG: KpsF/GutQ family sugar-phosphate isomerase [Lachnospiraceae bacterium]|nr:KpsF/GutQ family sugar-phosphate isomerase [Lachnospiraceae bacterium]